MRYKLVFKLFIFSWLNIEMLVVLQLDIHVSHGPSPFLFLLSFIVMATQLAIGLLCLGVDEYSQSNYKILMV